MNKTFATLSAVMVIAILILLAGCEAPSKDMPPYQTMDLAEPVPIDYKVIGGHPMLSRPGLTLINSQAQLDALGVEKLLNTEVNFNDQQVLLATLGEMPTAGYWINITHVNQVGDTLQVYGQANRPGPDDMTGQVLTYPYCAVVIPRTSATTLRDQIDSVEGLEPPM